MRRNPPLEHSTDQPSVPKQRLQRWPLLTDAILQPSVGSRLCLTCRWFHHQAELDAIPVLACRRHCGILSHGEHLSRCCAAWAA
jgi:hypothetical protein